jgi:molecular chaperone GrpE
MNTDDRSPEDGPKPPPKLPDEPPEEGEIPVYLRVENPDDASGSEAPGPASPPDSCSPPVGASKHPGRKKSGELKDAAKLKTLRSEIEVLKKFLEQTVAEAESARAQALAYQREIQDGKDKVLRTLAESDNLRKRLERDKNEFYQFALTDILKDVLLVLDNLERALRSDDASRGGFREGVELIRKQILDLVAKRGVVPIERPDRRFDPAVHQALTTEDREGLEEPMIGEELQKGYWLNDRLLRPALVKVLLPKKD